MITDGFSVNCEVGTSFGNRSLIRNRRASTAIKNIMLLVTSYFNHISVDKSMF